LSAIRGSPSNLSGGSLSEQQVCKNKGFAKQFFSEEKNQKTFAVNAIPNVSALASILPQAQS